MSPLPPPSGMSTRAHFQVIQAAKARQEMVGRFDVPGFRPNEHYVRWMKRFGILPESLDPAEAPIETDTDGLGTELKANLENPITTREDKAFMTYGHRKVTFVKENDIWKIEDPD